MGVVETGLNYKKLSLLSISTSFCLKRNQIIFPEFSPSNFKMDRHKNKGNAEEKMLLTSIKVETKEVPLDPVSITNLPVMCNFKLWMLSGCW